MEVSENAGTPIAGWFVSWKTLLEVGWFRDTPISGNLHIETVKLILTILLEDREFRGLWPCDMWMFVADIGSELKRNWLAGLVVRMAYQQRLKVNGLVSGVEVPLHEFFVDSSEHDCGLTWFNRGFLQDFITRAGWPDARPTHDLLHCISEV